MLLVHPRSPMVLLDSRIILAQVHRIRTLKGLITPWEILWAFWVACLVRRPNLQSTQVKYHLPKIRTLQPKFREISMGASYLKEL